MDKTRMNIDRVCLKTEQLEDRLVPALDLTGIEWRTINGTFNNLGNTTQGAAETMQIRFGYGQRFPDGFGDAIITAPQRANPRTISNALMAQSSSVVNSRHLTDWVFQWGQWITHDLDLTRTGSQWNMLSTGAMGDFRIPITDPNDPLYNAANPFIPFHRSEFAAGTGVPGVRRDVINSITSYLDASMVYGSDGARAAELRTYSGGRLKTSSGNLLPLNVNGFPNSDQFGAGPALFLAGDVRANEQIGLTAVHTLFVREHNRLAGRITQLQPQLNDEQVYQLARRLVAAEIQKITYEEYLPALFGYDFAPDPRDGGYDPTVDASVTNSFAHAFFRFGHSQINEQTQLVNNYGQTTGSLSIHDAFFNPNILKNQPGKLSLIIKGLASQNGQENDLLMVNGIRNNLFGPPGAGGLDLAALDIQRGRDHGLPDYNNLRGNYGLAPVTSFAEITSDPVIQQKLQQMFGTVDNIDAFVGALAEDHLPQSSAGPLLTAIISNQFLRLRDGDRFFYTRDPLLQSADVRAILDLKQVSLSQLIKWNTSITNIQKYAFFDPSVLIVQAPEGGANYTLATTSNTVTVFDTTNGSIVASGRLSDISQVIMVGSRVAADVFNVFVAGAGGMLEDGIVAYGGRSTGDRLNVYGRSGNDTFTVTGRTVSNNTTSASDPDVVLQRSVNTRTVSVNGNSIFGTGFETVRLVTLGPGDTILDPDGIVSVVGFWNPHRTD